MIYALLNAEGKCVNRVVWDGISLWSPFEGLTAIPDPDGNYPIYKPEQTEEDAT